MSQDIVVADDVTRATSSAGCFGAFLRFDSDRSRVEILARIDRASVHQESLDR